MEYRQLRSFVVLAQELHFGKAALRLNIVQPALSQHIKALEEKLGVALFIRDKRHVALTYEGQLLVAEAEAAIHHYDNFYQSARSLKLGFRGQIRLGYVGSSILDPAITMLINGYNARHPDIDVVIEEHNVNNQLAFLRNDRLDIVLVRSPVPHFAELEYLDIVTRPLIAVLPYQHPLAGKQKIALVSLADTPFLIQDDPPGMGLGWSVLNACQQAGFLPQKIRFTRDISAAIGLVSIGMGAALVPETQRSVMLPDISYSAIDDIDVTTTLTFSWKRHVKNRALEGFIRYIEELAHSRAGREAK